MSNMKVIGYVRVSSADQVEDGNSLIRQEEMIRNYCKLKGIESLEIIADRGVSGFKDNREGFQKLRSLCLQGQVKTVIVYDLSRLSRSVRGTLSFIEEVVNPNNIDFVSLSQNIETGTPMGKAFLSITAVFNELYRQEISYKTKNAKAHKKANNEKSSRFAPFGYEPLLSGKLAEKSSEQETLKIMQQLMNQHLPYKSIANKLNQMGRKTKSGSGKWYAHTVKAILDRQGGNQ